MNTPLYIDSHCHIDTADFDADRDAVLARAKAAGVGGLLLVGCADAKGGHRRTIEAAQALGFPASAGLHPHDAKDATEALYAELRAWVQEKKIVAIGEIGLDFHYDHSPRDVQREVFRRQIRLARELDRPVIIHTREADAETATILEEEGAAKTGGVIHCFTGGPELAERALRLGFYISFSGIVTFPRAEGIQKVAATVPLDRLLIETDAPFLAPVPHRGKRNEPAFVVEVARKLAALRGTSAEEIGAAARANFHALFRTVPRAR
jgi:TatD DNase family protein